MRATRRLQRALVAALGMALIVVGLPLLWYQLWLQPGAALVRVAFESGPAVTAGPGVSLDPASVSSRVGIPLDVPGAPSARLDLYAPAGAHSPLPVVLWFHGGGFIANSSADLAGYGRLLASSGHVVAMLDYTLAPAARYPTPVLQGAAALAWLERHAKEASRPGRRSPPTRSGMPTRSQASLSRRSATTRERSWCSRCCWCRAWHGGRVR